MNTEQSRTVDLRSRLVTEQKQVADLLSVLYGMDVVTAQMIAHQHRLGGPMLHHLTTKASVIRR